MHSNREPAFASEGWRPRVYRLGACALDFDEERADIAPGLVAGQVRLRRGTLRACGPVRPGWAGMGFLAGRGDPTVAVALGATDLAFTLAAPSTVLVLLLGPPLGVMLPREPIAFRVCPLADSGQDLMRAARSILCGESEPAEFVVRAGRVLAGLASARVGSARGAGSRPQIARAVESLLWREPATTGLPRVSLDTVARALACSRRSVQLALEEEFGVGFVALKRAIRLHQVQAVLQRDGVAACGVGRVARAHEFRHLSRFSSQYKEMFGTLPSGEGLGDEDLRLRLGTRLGRGRP